MKTSDLTTQQLQVLLNRAESDQGHYAQLMVRMQETGFSPDEPLRRQVERVHGELQGLRMLLHYAEIDSRRVH